MQPRHTELCSRADIDFLPLGIGVFGANGAYGSPFLPKLFDRYAIFVSTSLDNALGGPAPARMLAASRSRPPQSLGRQLSRATTMHTDLLAEPLTDYETFLRTAEQKLVSASRTKLGRNQCPEY